MPKKQRTEIEQAAAAETVAAPTPAKKRSASKTKSGATHKAAAQRPARAARKSVVEVQEPAVVETVEVVAAAAAAAAVVENTPAPTYYEPGTPEEREEVARIAYGYWEARSFAPGDPLVDWLRAEDEYRSRRYAVIGQ